MTKYELDVFARITVVVEAESFDDAEAKVRDAYGKVPPALEIHGEDVIYDFTITAIDENA